MHAWIWNDDHFETCASIPISDRGFRYGMSVFESMPVVAGEPQFLDEHLARLRNACAEREFACDPRAFDAAGAILRGQLSQFARIYVTAGDGAPAAPAKDPRMFIVVEERERTATEAFDLTISERGFVPLFGGLKTGNYWANLDALALAQRAGNHEALLFNESSELVSACSANVFVRHRTRLSTPALACGARAGVMREQVLQRLAVEERSLFVDDVRSADEIFLTNSWLGVMPVASVDGRELPSRETVKELGRQDFWRPPHA